MLLHLPVMLNCIAAQSRVAALRLWASCIPLHGLRCCILGTLAVGPVAALLMLPAKARLAQQLLLLSWQ